MLRVSKRCRLLVSLLLLCGCFLNFSLGNAFAVSVSSVKPAITYSGDFTDSGTAVGNYSFSVSSSRGEPVNYWSSVTASGATTRYQYGTTRHIITLSFVFENTSDTDYFIPFDSSNGAFSSFIKLSNIDFVNSTALYDVQNVYFDKIVSSSGGLVSFFNGSELIINPSPEFRIDNNFVIPANSSFEGVIEFSVSALQKNGIPSIAETEGNTMHFFSLAALNSIDISFPTDLVAVNPNQSISDSDRLDRIDDSIESQTQQQQQQYDDFTNDGASQGESFITDTDSAVKEKIGIFTFLDTLLENLLGLFAAPEGDAVITFPAFSMEIGGETHQIWADTQFNLSSLDDDFSVLLTAVRFGTVATVYFALINFLGDTYSRIFGGKSE